MVGRAPGQCCSKQHSSGMSTTEQTDTRTTGTIIVTRRRLLLADTYVVNHRPLHRGNRARHQLPIAGTWRREPRTPRMDERAVARRVPRVPEDVDDGCTPSSSQTHPPPCAKARRPGSVQLFNSEQRSSSVRLSITVSAGASTPGNTRVVAAATAGTKR